MNYNLLPIRMKDPNSNNPSPKKVEEFDEMRNKIHHPCKEVLDPRLTAKRLAKLFDKEKETMEVEPWI